MSRNAERLTNRKTPNKQEPPVQIDRHVADKQTEGHVSQKDGQTKKKKGTKHKVREESQSDRKTDTKTKTDRQRNQKKN